MLCIFSICFPFSLRECKGKKSFGIGNFSDEIKIVLKVFYMVAVFLSISYCLFYFLGSVFYSLISLVFLIFGWFYVVCVKG